MPVNNTTTATNINVVARKWADHQRELVTAARLWVQQTAPTIVRSAGDAPWTTATVMSALDMRLDSPPGYRAQTPQQRYTWVRYALAEAAAEGSILTTPTRNARGRDSTGYLPPEAEPDTPLWRVEVSGGPRSAAVAQQVERWLRANEATIGDLEGMLIVRNRTK